MTQESELPHALTADRLSETVLDWLGRSYQTIEEWKAFARGVFFAANGDSNVSRNRVASLVRSHLLESSPTPASVNRWSPGIEVIETVVVSPPKINASNAAYVDWLYVADYLLLACASPSEQLDEENQRRETEYQSVWGSYSIRLVVHAAREEMRRGAGLTDDECLAAIHSRHPKASMANIKEARRLEKTRTALEPPTAPIRAEPMRPYTSLFFGRLPELARDAPGETE